MPPKRNSFQPLADPLLAHVARLHAHSAGRVTTRRSDGADDAAAGFRVGRHCAVGLAADGLLEPHVEDFAVRVLGAGYAATAILSGSLGGGSLGVRGRGGRGTEGGQSDDEGAREDHVDRCVCVEKRMTG